MVRVEQEQQGTFNEGIELEDGTVASDDIVEGIQLEDEQDIETGDQVGRPFIGVGDPIDNIKLDGTEVVTPPADFVTLVVKVVRNADDTANIFQIGGVNQPTLALTQGNTYYFDLSDSSLYNSDTSQNHQLKFSTTSDGTHGSGSAYTTGVTSSAAYIDIGTTGAYIQIVVATDAPDLYYYCVNHSGMG